MASDGTKATCTQVVGTAYGADYNAPTPTHLNTAVLNMETAYTDAAGRPNTDAARINLGGGLLGGVFGGPGNQLTPGVYTFSTGVSITGNIHFDGTATDVFIIQIAGNLLTAANYNVILENGALANNIFWQVAGHVTIAAGFQMKGTILAKTAVHFLSQAKLEGRVLAQTACTLIQATITEKP
jgi:hypothetical protein